MTKTEVLLYGTKDGEIEELLSTKAENILTVIVLAKRDGYKNFRIVDYTDTELEPPDFSKTINL